MNIQFLVSFGFTVVCLGLLRKGLIASKYFQPIYELSPDSHQQKQAPSMGGIGVILVTILITLTWNMLTPNLIWLIGVFLTFGAIGLTDDLLSLKREHNKGLSAKSKFYLQCAAALILVGSYHVFLRELTLIEGIFYVFLMVGSSNATNLTDGLDGLLSGLSIMTLIGFYVVFNTLEMNAITLWCTHLTWVLLGFLVFNAHPAKLFLGDVGSLSLGAIFAGLSLVADAPFVLMPLGIVYILETLSVILQVGWYKRTQKRLFKMAPLHHHFELLGLSEPKVVILFWLIGAAGLGIFIGR